MADLSPVVHHTLIVVQQGGRRERLVFELSGGTVEISVQTAGSPLPLRPSTRKPLQLMSLR